MLPMGDLRDALRKANVLSKKDAKRLAHEERVHRSHVGREGLEQERSQREQELQARREEQREQSRRVQGDVQAQRQDAAERAACEEILRREVVPASSPNGQAFYVQLADGHLPRLSLGPVERANLERGHLCLVRVGPRGSHDYGLLATEHARRVRESLPDRVVWAARGVLG
jgi:ATP-dependent 26S proteasome regulatory subunit